VIERCIAVVIVLLALKLAACGGSDIDAPAAMRPDAAVPPAPQAASRA
jgi:hypothetical protein